MLGEDRHELKCAGCGAGLHDLKMLPKGAVDPAAHKTQRSGKAQQHWEKKSDPRRKKKKKSKKSFGKRFFEEAFDVLEDIFD